MLYTFRKYLFKIYILVFLFGLIQIDCYGQKKDKDRFLETLGVVEDENGNRISDVKVDVISALSNGIVESVYTKKNGRFDLTLNINKEYILKFSKEGYILKKITLNTRIKNPSETIYQYEYTLILSTTIVDEYGPEILGKPVVKVYYNPEKKQFDYDSLYTVSVKRELANLSVEQRKGLTEKLELQKKYEKNALLKKQAEQEFNSLVVKVEAENRIKNINTSEIEKQKVEIEKEKEEFLKKQKETEERLLIEEELKKKQEILLKTLKEMVNEESIKDKNENSSLEVIAKVVIKNIPQEIMEEELELSTPKTIISREAVIAEKIQDEIQNIETKMVLRNQNHIINIQNNREKNTNFDTKYNTKNPLTNLLDIVDVYEKDLKRNSKPQESSIK